MNAGSQPSFVDTNVLVYAVADDDPVRQLAAQTLVDTLAAAQALHTSTQVLQELYVVLTRRVRRKFTSAEAIDYLDRIARAPVTTTDYRLVRQAALDRDTSVNQMVRDYLAQLASDTGERRSAREDLKKFFRTHSVTIGKRTWTRDDLHERR
jgi:predicted nucleic acid-binding protein